MKVLGLDLSTKPGWAFKEDDQPFVFGAIKLDHPVISYGDYPWSYDKASEVMASMLFEIVLRFKPDVVVIEETNLGKSRYAQKTLEFIHKALLARLRDWNGKVIYLSSSSWRQALGLQMSKEDKKNNAKLSKAKKLASESGMKLDKKALGVRGKINKKHLALRYVNETYGLALKVKDNDAADAICLAAAYLKGAQLADGVM
jgi:Holliday junction resolvasome RuvABC endonuclease subunit